MCCRLLYGLLIMGHGRRQLLWFEITAHPTAEWIAAARRRRKNRDAAPRRRGHRRPNSFWSACGRKVDDLCVK
jgi:hypothetical protein